VARALADVPGFASERLRLAPYGISGVLLKPVRPTPGRVLFAGAAGLRKGLPYLAAAARLLKARRPEIAVVVAGHASDLVRARPETRDLAFLGVLDREQMADEYARADVFCLPSLAEGSATSIFEAMANGLPAVTTPSSGSVVTDGVEGLIVPERDAEGLAGAIERVIADRGLREQMSAAAILTAKRYDDAACGARFIEVVEEALRAA
jgi:glycosyltransferase involved in cell wall biosynthesis